MTELRTPKAGASALPPVVTARSNILDKDGNVKKEYVMENNEDKEEEGGD